MNKNKLYVGNLSYQIETEDLKKLFSPFGEIIDIVVIKDKETGRSRGFGFVTFVTEEQASAAIASLNGTEIVNRPMRIKYAEPRKVEVFA